PRSQKKGYGSDSDEGHRSRKAVREWRRQSHDRGTPRYSINLSVAAVNIGMPSFEMVKQNVELARNFKPLSPQEIRAIQDKTAAARASLESFFVHHSDIHTA